MIWPGSVTNKASVSCLGNFCGHKHLLWYPFLLQWQHTFFWELGQSLSTCPTFKQMKHLLCWLSICFLSVKVVNLSHTSLKWLPLQKIKCNDALIWPSCWLPLCEFAVNRSAEGLWESEVNCLGTQSVALSHQC